MPKIVNDKNIRYVEGAVLSMLRLRRYLLSRGVDPEEVDERIKKQAIGMLEASGLSKEKIVEILIELKLVVEVLIELVSREMIQESGE
ncbi:MAG: hypothetical protein RMI56_05155 [Sulfolobales archaeon]|nr:hypothetical protein [Sulfolobales archaeon]MDW8083167.1 hypothetical protein [Sulfolobales archaeon]